MQEKVEIGASSACFYPLETERSFLHIAELGFNHCEIFFNAHSELRPDFIKELKTVKDAYGINVISLHPYASFGEGYDFFSAYKRRFGDAMDNYKRYFDAASILGAKYIVMHGASRLYDIDMEEYARRFALINETAQSFGCCVAHENVVNFLSATPDFSRFMKEQLGDGYKMVLDVKQARRAGYEPEEFIGIMKKNIVHVHLSDYSEQMDCIAPCEEGLFDFENLFRLLHKAGYNGKYIIELYSDGYGRKREITKSAKYLDAILKKVRQG
ncbi:MAG: sugar phosphate isomerase/epimerase [Ruminococcaceae bacterium]|nr:sugar phosphate isomerase/epimerase [Oscillospiraceae bacterium]